MRALAARAAAARHVRVCCWCCLCCIKTSWLPGCFFCKKTLDAQTTSFQKL